jgi:C-terminal processing protease CtpA/Prc
MALDRTAHAGHHTITVSSIVKDNSVMRDGRIKVGDRITHIDNQACEVGERSEIVGAGKGTCGPQTWCEVSDTASCQR